MTKSEALKFLMGTKVYVDGKSKEIQEKLYSIGFKYYNSDEIKKTDYPFIYIYDTEIEVGLNMDIFNQSELREIKANEIISLDFDKEIILNDIVCDVNGFIGKCDKITENGHIMSRIRCDRQGGCYFQNEKTYYYNMGPLQNLSIANEIDKEYFNNAIKNAINVINKYRD